MAEVPVNLVSDEESSSEESDSEELPEVEIPCCSHRIPNMQNQEESSSSSSESESEESSESSDDSSSSPPPARANTARPELRQANKRGIQGRQIDKEAKKRRLAEERAAKRQKMNEMQIYKPGQCMKYMHLEIHPTLASAWFMADVARELEATGAKIHGTPSLIHPGLIVWTRVIPKKLITADGQVQLSADRQQCGTWLYVCTAEEVAERVEAQTLLPHIDSLREMVDGDLSVIIFGDFKCSSRRTANSNRKALTELQVEQIKIDLLISTGVDVQFMDKPGELSMWILHCTKAVAEAPFKKAKRDIDYAVSGFYMRGDNKKCVAVDKEGHGLARLWQQMVSVLPAASLESARAICAKYKSPPHLINNIKLPYGLGDLAALGVTRAAAPQATARRLGPELARKLHLLYTSRNGNIVVE